MVPIPAMPLSAIPKPVGCWSACGGQEGSIDHANSGDRVTSACEPAWLSRAACKTTTLLQAMGAHAPQEPHDGHAAAAQLTRGFAAVPLDTQQAMHRVRRVSPAALGCR
eukprot:362665-Chlamydomonas_euryale.AAC.2